MKNIENWKLSNRISSIGMILISIVNIIIFYVLSLMEFKSNKYQFLIIFVIEIVILCYIIEKKLTQNESK